MVLGDFGLLWVVLTFQFVFGVLPVLACTMVNSQTEDTQSFS